MVPTTVTGYAPWLCGDAATLDPYNKPLFLDDRVQNFTYIMFRFEAVFANATLVKINQSLNVVDVLILRKVFLDIIHLIEDECAFLHFTTMLALRVRVAHKAERAMM